VRALQNEQDPIVIILLLIVCSILIRQALIIAGQFWIRTYAHTLTTVLLPLITYSITTVIAGNIALSLGMVGALSIVRFRNPVKSPFELVVFFLLITMGITAGVDINVLLALTLVTILVLFGFKAVDIAYMKARGKNFFQISFSEGSELPTVEIESSEKIDGFLELDELISFSMQGSRFHYILASRQKESLLKLVKELEQNAHVDRVRFSTY
jgi:hypothetical protein